MKTLIRKQRDWHETAQLRALNAMQAAEESVRRRGEPEHKAEEIGNNAYRAIMKRHGFSVPVDEM